MHVVDTRARDACYDNTKPKSHEEEFWSGSRAAASWAGVVRAVVARLLFCHTREDRSLKICHHRLAHPHPLPFLDTVEKKSAGVDAPTGVSSLVIRFLSYEGRAAQMQSWSGARAAEATTARVDAKTSGTCGWHDGR